MAASTESTKVQCQQHEGIGIRVGVAWTQGRRPSMQDAHTVVFFTDTKHPCAIIGVYDGHGKTEFAAEYAAQHLPGMIVHELQTVWDRAHDAGPLMCDAMKKAFIDADASLADAVARGGSNDRSGCTAHTVVVLPSQILIANAGDSRSVYMDAGRGIVATSKDHKPTDPAELRRIEQAGSMVTEAGRIDGVLNLSRGLGDFDLKRAPVEPAQQAVSPEPDVRLLPRYQNGVVVIACDGLWDVISSHDAGEMASKMMEAGATPRDVAVELVSSAFKLGSRDNISAAVVALA